MKSILIRGLAVVNEIGDIVGDSILVYNGLIEGIGPESRFTGMYSLSYEFNGYIIPSIVDAHLHIKGIGLNSQGVDLRGVSSIKELRDKLRGSKAPIIYGRGWDQELFHESRWPTRWDIDDVTSGRAAVLVRVCGHVALLNTKALEMTRPWEFYPESVEMRAGTPTGVIFEDAVAYVLEKLLSMMDMESIVVGALRELYRNGIAGASSMSCNEGELKALEGLARRAGALPVKISCYPDYAKKHLVVGGVNGWVEIVGFKMYADGSLGARTAYLRDSYTDSPGVRGVLLAGRRVIEEALVEAEKLDLRLAVHAIGDAALDEVLAAAEALKPRGLRVEHASVIWDDQIEVLKNLEIPVVVQPRFRVGDWWIEKRLGSRVKLAYRFKTMISRGVKIALSSDAPVEPLNPNETIRAAMSECEQPTCFIEEALSIREIIESYTKHAAEVSGGPLRWSGVIGKGRPADFTITKLNPLWDKALEPLEVIVSGLRASEVFKYSL